MHCTVATADSHLSYQVIHVTMQTSSFNAQAALGTGTLASLLEHLSAKTVLKINLVSGGQYHRC